MFSKFRPSTKPEVNPETGEISAPAQNERLPELGKSRRVTDIAGVQPEYINLKDHPELSGQTIAIVKVLMTTGEFGDYVKIGCYKVLDGAAVAPPFVIMTGSENVLARALAVQDWASSESPVLGVLRQVGDAWLLD